jgi:hypothetical protein
VRVGDAGWRRSFEGWGPESRRGRHQSCSPSEGESQGYDGNHASLSMTVSIFGSNASPHRDVRHCRGLGRHLKNAGSKTHGGRPFHNPCQTSASSHKPGRPHRIDKRRRNRPGAEDRWRLREQEWSSPGAPSCSGSAAGSKTTTETEGCRSRTYCMMFGFEWGKPG